MATSKDRRTQKNPAEAPSDALRQLGERLERATLEARRLAVEAAEAALRGAPLPPDSGWAVRGDGDQAPPGAALDGVIAALASLRDLVPPELQRRLAEAVRELLVAIRALLDWYIDHLDRPQTAADDAEDIPIL